MKKIAFIGNCQVDTYYKLLKACDPGFDIFAIEVWRLKPDEFELANDKLMSCDLIVTQPLSAHYGPLALENLRATQKPILTIHNIYFRGYHPDCEYMGPAGNRLKSPIGDYHSKVVYQAFEKGLNSDKAIEGILNYPEDQVRRIFNESADELKRREIDIDVPIADLVLSECGWSYFYTFNHPKLELCSRYLKAIIKTLGLNISFNTIRDPLQDHTHFPIYPGVVDALGLPVITKQDIAFTSPKQMGGHIYNLTGFCHSCYASYAINMANAASCQL